MRLDLEMIVIIMSWCAPALQHHFVKHFKSAFIEILKLLAEFQNMIKKISTRFSKEHKTSRPLFETLNSKR